MTWKLYAVVSAGAFAATYLMSTPAPERVRPSQSPSSARQAAADSDIEALAARLHVRQPANTGYRAPSRDPFHFQSRPSRPAVTTPVPPVVVETPAPAPVLPVLSLSGIASDIVAGQPRRSAVISLPNGVLIVREGESVAGLYTVVSIGDQSVELQATADGSRRTLQLAK